MPLVPLAYKFVATTVMLMELNYCATRLQLPINLPIKAEAVRVMIAPPDKMGFAGRLDTKEYSFSFPKSAKLCYITRLERGYQAHSTTKVQGELSTPEFLRQLVKVHSVINTNDAYRIATNWLTRIQVDVARLEREHPPVLKQQSINGHGVIPVFYVDWGEFKERSGPAVRVMIAGDTKDLLYLRQEAPSYSGRPGALIRDMDKLLAIPDAEFVKYSPLERSNLVARFAAVHYSTGTNAPITRQTDKEQKAIK
jgi:hypothetical protein